jgi:glutathione S-transferase
VTTRRLITIPISHYCEKARWALDWAGLPYREEPWLPVLNRLATRRAGGGNTVPVLVCAEGTFADSSAILRYASDRSPAGRRLYPEGADAEIAEWCRDFDRGFGVAARLWTYAQLLPHRRLAIRYAAHGLPAWQRVTLRLGYPALAGVLRRGLGLTPASVERATARVARTFDRVAAALADGRPYLFGDAFTAADLTFAALAAAVVMPFEYGVPLLQPISLPPAVAAAVDAWRAHPAGAFALRQFREHR